MAAFIARSPSAVSIRPLSSRKLRAQLATRFCGSPVWRIMSASRSGCSSGA
jgi:hypothetical protein